MPPREHGGNCDIKDLSRGSKVYFPVYVTGAGLSMGDLHFSQGDGEITFCGAIEMAGWVHMKVDLIKGGMAQVRHQEPVFKPSPITPNYKDYLIFEGISVDEAGKQHYLDVNVAYRQACLNAIEYLKKFGYSGAQAYSILGTAPCRATSAASSTCPTPAPRCGCRRRSSTSTSCRRRRDRSNTSRATSRCRSRRTSNPGEKDAGRQNACRRPASTIATTSKNSREETRCPSTNISAPIAARSRPCGRWPNATIRRIARSCGTESPRVILPRRRSSACRRTSAKRWQPTSAAPTRRKAVSRIQGRARPRLRLLLDRQEEAGPAGDQVEERRQRLPTARPWMISH